MRTALRIALLASPLLTLLSGCSKPRPGAPEPGADAGIVAGTGECNSCHGSTESNAPPFDLLGQVDPANRGVGAHRSHVLNVTLSDPVPCASCHIVPKTKDDPGHMDGPWPAKVVFADLALAKGANPQLVAPQGTGKARDDATLLISCSGVYCHGATLTGGKATAPVWNQPDPKWKACDACHGFPPTKTEDGSAHPASTKCGACHNQDFAVDGTLTRPDLHINGQVEVTTVSACNSCHGSAENWAPPVDTQGGTDTALTSVGAHQSHLKATLSDPVSCDICHVVPASVDSPGHIGEGPAVVRFSKIAASGGATPSWDHGTATCASTYCHGSTLHGGQAGGTAIAPLWTRVDGSQKACDSCHGNPPPAASGHPQSAACSSCHDTVAADNKTIAKPAQHVDGIVQKKALACNTCHGSAANSAPPADTSGRSETSLVSVGAHQTHLKPAMSAPVGCDGCHPVPSTFDHADGTVDLAFGAVAKTRSSSPAWNHTAATCASTWCHAPLQADGTSAAGAVRAPSWTKVDGTQSACGSCHGLPPPAPHPQSSNCSGCHDTVAGDNVTIAKPAQHVDGVIQERQAGCNTCHGSAANDAPPVDTAGNSATALVSVGAHQTHLKTTRSKPVACSECHPVPTSTTHSNKVVDVSFGSLTKTGGLSPAWSHGAATCASTWCHAPVQAGNASAGGTARTPSWTKVDNTQNACGACHGLPPPAPHTQSSNCSSCHDTVAADNVTIAKPAQHVDGVTQVKTLSCSSCHGSATNAAPPVDTHGQSATTAMTVGAHQAHLTATTAAPVACSECHPVPTSTSHSNSALDLAFGALAKTGGLSPGFNATTGSCASTWCHAPVQGNASSAGGTLRAPVWNKVDRTQDACGTCHGLPPPLPHIQRTDCSKCHDTVAADNVTIARPAQHVDGIKQVLNMTCTSCHGGTANAAPPLDTHGQSATSNMTVGAHQSHLTTTTSAQVACSECHPVQTSTAHSNGTIDLTFGALSKTGGMTPSFNAATGSCASTWCHGPKTAAGQAGGGTANAPLWTTVNGSQKACDSCHGNPPPAPHVQNASCSSCHTNVSASDNRTMLNPALHVNGTVEYQTLTCNTCHGGTNAAPPADTTGQSATSRVGVGAHQAHLSPTSSAIVGCSECHTVPNTQLHETGTVELTFGARSKTGSLTPSWTRASASCASTWCHAPVQSGGQSAGGTIPAPVWTTVNGSQDACGTCHGLPPPAPHTTSTACSGCHDTVDANRNIVKPAQHVDGIKQVTAGSCNSCHGSAANNAPPTDTSGQSATTLITVGAHQAHLTATTSKPVACTECHPVPAAVGDPGHNNGTIDVVFGTLSKTSGRSPSFSTSAATCASTWCHAPVQSGGQASGGSIPAPLWTKVDGTQDACGSCHGLPPPAPHSTSTSCSGCHDTVDASRNIVKPAQHIDGIVQASGESSGGAACSGCHSSTWTNMSAATKPAGVVSRHTLGNVAGTNDSATDTSTAWTGQLGSVPAANRSCVDMCHSDHAHDLPAASVTSHQNNVYVDASTQSSRAAGTKTSATRAATDFDNARTNGGLCTSCHAQAVDASHPAVSKAMFAGSAHDYTANTQGTWSYTLHDSSTFARNCTKCHADRGDTRPGDSASPFGSVHFSGYPSLLAGSTNPGGNASNDFLCFNCHGNGTAGTDLSGKNLAAATALAKNHPSLADATHNAATEATATWNSGAFSGSNRHASCLDCHDPHQAGKTLVNRTAAATSARNQIGAASPLKGADGVQFGIVAGRSYPTLPSTACASGATLPNACFTTTAASNFSANLVPASYEYEVCFKCHSSFAFGNTSYPTAPSSNASGLQQTDVAAEFSPTNKSGHPVVTGLSNYTGNTAPKALVAAQLLAPWNTNPGTQTMLCTDCHNTDAASPAVQGPHGSAVTFMLDGTNRAWPYTVAGANSGTLFRLNTSETGLGTANGLFCRNCHPSPSTSGSGTNNLHTMTNSKHGSNATIGPCVACHIRVPHGGKVSRLIVTTNAPARYKVGTPNFTSFGKASTPSGYGSSNFKSSCSKHSGGTGGEAW